MKRIKLWFWKPQTENQRKATPCIMAMLFGMGIGMLSGALAILDDQNWRGSEWVICAIMPTMMAFCLYRFVRHPDVRRWYNQDKADKKAEKIAKENRHEVA